MASLATLVASLKEVANVTANDVISDTLAGTFLTQALAQHNPLYTVSSLPAREEEAVQILAWIKVCLKRASNVVSQQTAHGPAGFGQDRETPYRKNTDMVGQLQRQYQAVCGRLGLSNDGTGVTVSHLTTLDDRTDAVTPLSLEPTIGPLVLTVTQSTTNLSIFDFTWDFPTFDNFDSVQLFMVERALTETDDALYQEWNYESDTGIPRLLNGATLLTTITRADQKAVRVTELDFLLRHRFLAVLKTRSGHYAYSEEAYVPGLLEDQGTPAYTWTPISDMTLGTTLASATTYWSGEFVQPNLPKGQAMALGDYMAIYYGGSSFSPQTGKYAVSLPGCMLITNGDGGGTVAGALNTATPIPYYGLFTSRAAAEAANRGLVVFGTQTINPAVTSARIGLKFVDPSSYGDNTGGTGDNGTASDWTLYRKVLT